MDIWLNINKGVKRAFDFIASLAAIILLSPVLLICAIWIKTDSEGPVIFRQERRTRNGRIFKMYKFRSMITNAEKQGAGLFNYENDPRVTRAGRFLRKTSLDELPQLWNVVKGDMSVVGPRPCVAYELGDFETLNARFRKRFEATAGITGYAQIQGRNDLPWDQKVDFDGRYIDLFRKWGCLIDAYIIGKTFVDVFRQKNIYENKEDEVLSDEEAARKAEEEIIRLAHE
ncbi:MAG: sugar transferase [Prevotella sp.]|nr:sugar transferase [Prevotella sp.]